MDRPDCDTGKLRQALETIDRAGRWSGRDRILRHAVSLLLRDAAGDEVALLDVGAGAGHGTLRLARRLSGRGWRPRLVLADLHPGALRIARERRPGAAPEGVEPMRIDLVRLSGACLPFSDRSFEVAVCSNTMHHLRREEASRLMAEMARVARRGFAIVDLRRSRFVYAATRLLARTLWRRRSLPRHDGPTSVRRAFTPREAEGLLRSAGLEGGEVRAHVAWIGIRWRRVGDGP